MHKSADNIGAFDFISRLRPMALAPSSESILYHVARRCTIHTLILLQDIPVIRSRRSGRHESGARTYPRAGVTPFRGELSVALFGDARDARRAMISIAASLLIFGAAAQGRFLYSARSLAISARYWGRSAIQPRRAHMFHPRHRIFISLNATFHAARRQDDAVACRRHDASIGLGFDALPPRHAKHFHDGAGARPRLLAAECPRHTYNEHTGRLRLALLFLLPPAIILRRLYAAAHAPTPATGAPASLIGRAVIGISGLSFMRGDGLHLPYTIAPLDYRRPIARFSRRLTPRYAVISGDKPRVRNIDTLLDMRAIASRHSNAREHGWSPPIVIHVLSPASML